MKVEITARVQYNVTRGAKVKTTTFVSIFAGVDLEATRHLSGRYSQEQAMVEFRRFPEKFLPAVGATLETLKVLARVA
jgi:hypothetical protein